MKKDSRGSRIGIVRRLVRRKEFETSRDYLQLRPQRMGHIGFRPATLGHPLPHNVGYELVKSFEEVVVTNIPITVNPMMDVLHLVNTLGEEICRKLKLPQLGGHFCIRFKANMSP